MEMRTLYKSPPRRNREMERHSRPQADGIEESITGLMPLPPHPP